MTFALGTGFSIGANPRVSGLPRFRHNEVVTSFVGEAHDVDLDKFYHVVALADTATSFTLGHGHIVGQVVSNDIIAFDDPFLFAVGDKITISGTYETV